MTIAALMLILLVAPASSPVDNGRPPTAVSGPMLLDFHADWCGPCRQMRPAVANLIKSGYPVKSINTDTSPALAARYKVGPIPCFIVVDENGRELDRVEGSRPAAELAALFNESTRDLPVKSREELAEKPARRTREVSIEDDDEPKTAARIKNPKPWETVVRIKVHDGKLMGYGSGTIIYSTSEEAIILSCAHIFKIHGPLPASPKQFTAAVSVDLFDGKITRTAPNTVHYANESFRAEVIDYDFGKDVSLIRIRPGRKLPASRVVPTEWVPKAGQPMIAVGCPEGQDATSWDTEILTPKLGLDNGAGYEGMGCRTAPKQGRSGGGLYTPEGFVAGVCDFAEPKGNVGLYATPKSIHRILDRNRLMALYERPTDPERRTLLANNRPKPTRAEPTKPQVIARAQSPDEKEAAEVSIPDPSLLGIRSPGEDDEAPLTTRVSRPRPQGVWQGEHKRALTTEMRRPPVEFVDQLDEAEDEDPQPIRRPASTARTKSLWQVERSFD